MLDYNLYRAIVAVHVFGAFAFLLAHGASASVAFRLKRERNRERVAALLELSTASTKGMGLSFVLLLGSAFTLGYFGEWFGTRWFWAALILFFALSGLMTPFAGSHYTRVRRSMGLKSVGAPKRLREPLPPLSDEELDRELLAVRPWALLFVGLGGVAALQYLMMFKPF